MVDAVKKERDRHAQRLTKFIEAAGADTAFPLFVFVHLLKRETQGCRQFLLAYTRHDTPLSQTRCDMLVDCPKSFAAPSHRWPPFDETLPDRCHEAYRPVGRPLAVEPATHRGHSRPGAALTGLLTPITTSSPRFG